MSPAEAFLALRFAQRGNPAERLGTSILAMCDIGAGIMGMGLSGGSVALTLFADAFATGHILYLLIAAAYWFTGSASFVIPAVTIARSLSERFTGILPAHAPGYIAAQLIAAVLAALTLPKHFSN